MDLKARHSSGIRQRGLADTVADAWAQNAVVIIEGGRATGKTTLCRALSGRLGIAQRVDLSDPQVREEAAADPHGFVASLTRPAFIDEAQLVDELTVAIKRIVDDHLGAPAQFLLTGSTKIGRGALGGSDPLVGRAARLRLRSFTVAERLGIDPPAISRLFTPPASRQAVPAIDRASVLHLAAEGGLPSAPGVIRAGSTSGQQQFIDQYVEGVLHLAVSSRRTDRASLLHLTKYLAANPAQILVASRVANDLGHRAETVADYLDVLSNGGLIWRCPQFRATGQQAARAHPKLQMADTALIGWGTRALRKPEATPAAPAGGIFENFASNELLAQCDWSLGEYTLGFWRHPKSGAEVDAVISDRNGDCVAIEFKLAGSARAADTQNFGSLARQLGDRLVARYVLYTGERLAPLDADTWALPFSVLTGAAECDW